MLRFILLNIVKKKTKRLCKTEHLWRSPDELISSYYLLQAKLSAVMETFTSVAVQKICKVFSYCFALNKTQFEGFNSYVNDDDVIHGKALVKEHEKKPERKKRQAVRDVPGKTSCIYFNVTCKKI